MINSDEKVIPQKPKRIAWAFVFYLSYCKIEIDVV